MRGREEEALYPLKEKRKRNSRGIGGEKSAAQLGRGKERIIMKKYAYSLSAGVKSF